MVNQHPENSNLIGEIWVRQQVVVFETACAQSCFLGEGWWFLEYQFEQSVNLHASIPD